MPDLKTRMYHCSITGDTEPGQSYLQAARYYFLSQYVKTGSIVAFDVSHKKQLPRTVKRSQVALFIRTIVPCVIKVCQTNTT